VLAASKTSAKSTKKTSILLIGALSTAIIVSISWYFFFAKLPIDQRDIYVQIPVLVTQFGCLVTSLVTVLRLGLKSSEGRYYLSRYCDGIMVMRTINLGISSNYVAN
jgi:hypothetical protein